MNRHVNAIAGRPSWPAGHLAHFIRDMVRDDLNLSAILGTYDEMRGYRRKERCQGPPCFRRSLDAPEACCA